MSDNITREPYRNAWYKQLQEAIKEAEPRLVPVYSPEDADKILSIDEEGKQVWREPPEELPVIQESDEGKVLKVEEGGPKWAEDSDNEIPSHTASDEGKMLSVNAQNGLEWKDVPKELPEATSADEGKVLSVDSNGLPEWATSSGGNIPIYDMTWNNTSQTYELINTTKTELVALYTNGSPFLLRCSHNTKHGVFIPSGYDNNKLFCTRFISTYSNTCRTEVIYNTSETKFQIIARYVLLLEDSNQHNMMLTRDNNGHVSMISFPMPTSADAGKVLTVDSNGNYVLTTPT